MVIPVRRTQDDPLGMPVLFLPETLGHSMHVAVTFLGNAGTILPDFVDHRIGIHAIKSNQPASAGQ
jgi:hypothetical protein